MDAVGLDLDETLAVPTRDRPTILREAMAAVDGPPITREEYLRAHGEHLTADSRTPIFAALLSEYDSDVDPERAAEAYRERLTAALEPVEGAERLIAALREEYAVGLLTNGPTTAQRAKLAGLAWEDRFDVVAISGDLPAGKPDRRAFEALLADLGVEPGDAVYVGDQVEADVEGAQAAGMRAIHVVGPDADPAPTADATVSRRRIAAELPAALASLQE